MEVSISGWLYEPQAPQNPSGFSFREYLAKQGIFAGLKGYVVDWDTATASSEWGWWQLRDRIVRTQVQRLGVPNGTVVSAMVLGRRAVDLPYDVRDRFIEVGLAHALAASGFHVSLILGAVLGVGRFWSDRSKFALGSLTLLLYVGLVGPQPSVLRAALMGFAGLLGLVAGRRVNPLGVLLLAATLLLLVNPRWIADLGFQLSFLATLGLFVTVPALQERLDWLPSTLTPLLAVPVAAILWTLPLQLYNFGQIPTYSLLANVLAAPLLSLVTLGGFFSAIAALLYPPLGSLIAWGLDYPVRLLLALVDGVAALPHGAIAVRPLDLWQLGFLYALIAALWWWYAHRKPFTWTTLGAIFLAAAVVLLPAAYAKANLLRVTILAAETPEILLQQGWRTTAIHSGEADVTRYGVLPFLQQEGVNRLDAVVATDSFGQGWPLLEEEVSPRQVYRLSEEPLVGENGGTPLVVDAEMTQEAMHLHNLSQDFLALALTVEETSWLVLGDISRAQQRQLLQSGRVSDVDLLVFFGRSLEFDLVDAITPEVAIIGGELNAPSQRKLGELGVVRWQLDGAIQWTPDEGVRAAIASREED
jgi:competence protein ComEC